MHVCEGGGMVGCSHIFTRKLGYVAGFHIFKGLVVGLDIVLRLRLDLGLG